MQSRVEKLLQRRKDAENMRTFFHSHWREQANYFRQNIDNIGTEKHRTQPNTSRQSALFDSVGSEAASSYAAGCMAWLSPSESAWFKFAPPKQMEGDDEITSWYSKCTEVTREVLANSNFYREIHKLYLDDGVFGTGSMHMDTDPVLGLNFRTMRIGSYSILEDMRGNVDTVFEDKEFTPRQAVEKFGEENVGKSVLQAWRNPQRIDKSKFMFTRVVVPNNEIQRGYIDATGMPWSIIWIAVDDKVECSVEGAWSMPTFVHRHMTYTDTAWGFGPGWQATPDMRQLNEQQMFLDSLVETLVVPRVLAHVDHEGKIDMRPGGVTTFTDPNKIPKVWLENGSYPAGVDRVEWRQNNIRRAFHNHLFQVMSEIPPGKEVTATEIVQRQRDQLPAFSPTFAAKMVEVFNPLGRRAFGALLRMQAYPPPPKQLQIQMENGIHIPDPRMVYSSRMALQIEALENESFGRYFESLGAFAQLNPGVVDHVNWDAAVREYGRNEGVPENWIMPESDVRRMREARAEEQARLQEQEMALQESQAVKNESEAVKNMEQVAA